MGLLRNLSNKSFPGFEDSTQLDFQPVKYSNQDQFGSRTTNVMDFVYSFRGSSRINIGNSVSDFAMETSRPKHNCKELITQFESVSAPNVSTMHFTSFLVGGFVGSKSQLGRRPTKGFGVKMWDKISQFLDVLGNVSSDISVKDNNPCKFPSDKKHTNMTKPVEEQTFLISNKNNDTLQDKQERTRPKQSYAEVAKSMATTKSTHLPKSSLGGEYTGCDTSLKDNRLPKLVIEPIISCSQQPGSIDRNRFISECSADSEDSFIVFEYCEGDTNSFVGDDSESSDDESVCSSPENEECSSSACDSASSHCKFNNNKQEKKVRFAEGKELAKVHEMVAWDFAYRSARRGQWEMLARDSARFKARIKNTEALLAPILHPQHRATVYQQRFV